jgi:hypothetical protein
METLEIVVARYKEDLSWVDMINPAYTVTVYNKHDGENLVENIGRESHTYLHHIIQRYDSLADYTLFVQGAPLEHCDIFYQSLDHFCSLKEKQDFSFLLDSSSNMIQCDNNGQPYGIVNESMIPVGYVYEKITMRKSPGFFISSPGSQFIVSKKAIKNWKLEFYKKAIETISYSSNPLEGHCFERMFPMIFEPRLQYSNLKIQYPNDKFHNDYLGEYFIDGEIKLFSGVKH